MHNMYWYKCKLKDFIGIECINPNKNKYILRLSHNNKNIESSDEDIYDIRYLLIKVNERPKLQNIKKELLYLQQEYSDSLEIKQFIINNNKFWFDKETRVSIVNAINLQKQLNKSTYTIWLDYISIELDINKALHLLALIEDYANICYNITQKHLNEIKNLKTIEDCINYNITSDYPNILNITIN